ncbi:MAG TPA: pantoate--beta-alanine ligase [Candidatus Binataceae bacterium]|nr:pantoate--beta-alanine ligase [Candidatus Binataceae bacterium]
MEIITTPTAMQRRAESERLAGRKIAFVPTMGFLHEGHLSLMREGRRRAEVLVASIFVNPTQFGPNEDFGRYPRAFERDCEMMRTVPVDLVFAPEPEAMYPEGAETWVEAVEITKGLCGAHRPGHFRGVTTVVAKLFNLVKPHYAMFGEKDFQQLRAIQRMVKDLNFDLEIVPMPTVREQDGIAMSSRNAYLSSEERERALSLSRALKAVGETFAAGSRDPRDLVRTACAVLSATPGVRIEYIEAVDAETLRPIARVERPVVVAIAAHVGKTRLIDNAVFAPA